jgi:putative ABC transport system permease protein
MIDAVDRVITLQFNDVQRDDVTLMFRQPMSSSAAFDLLHLPGVMRAETFRAVGADIRHNRMKRRTVLYGVPRQRDLKQVVHADGALVEIPREGAVMTQYLARVLDVRIGDTVAVEILEGDRRTVKVPIVSTVDEILGTQLYLDEHALNGLMREQGSVSGGYLQVDKQRLDELYRAVKRTPAVAGVMIRQTAIDNFKKTYEENMNVSSMSIIIFACIIAFGVVYNNARIALSERGNELASLRVLGFTIGEIATVLLGEQVLLTMLAVPLGLLFGGWVSSVLPGAFETEFFRIPVVFTVRNFGLAAGVTMLVTVLTGLLLYRRLKKLDLIAVLKTRE